MLNIFNLYGTMWLVILVLYNLGWSDLCSPLSVNMWIFIVTMIIVSYVCGWKFRRKLKFICLVNNPHKRLTVIKILVCLYMISFFVSGFIPLLEVWRGTAYNSLESYGIPHLNLFINSFSVYYSIYLSYIYVCFKQKKVLLEYGIIVLYFILLVQRQNVFICVAFMCNLILAKNREKIKRIYSRHKIFNTVISILIGAAVLYCMGVMGNMRYGNMWKWYDSSMIMALGKANGQFPVLIPTPFYWSYLYLVSPLATLNYNVIHHLPNGNVGGLICEFIPQFVSNKLGYEQINITLLRKSLTVATGYARVYLYVGYAGMLMVYFISLFICIFIVNQCRKHNKEYLVVVINGLLYFLLFNFFTNTFYYPTTVLCLIFSFFCCYKYRVKGRQSVSMK